MKLKTNLTLSIVSHGHGQLIERLIGQLDNTKSLKGVRLIVTLNKHHEVVLYDQNPPMNLEIITIRNPSPLGFGANHNRAFLHCKTKWFAILNPDLHLPEDIFSPMIIKAEENKAALTAPLIIDSLGNIEDSVRMNLTPFSLLRRRFNPRSELRLRRQEFRWFAGMFYLVDSNVYRAIGGFNERFFLYCEDYDICARLHLNGHKLLFQSNIKVVHDARRSSRKSWKYFINHLTSMLKVWFSPIVWKISIQDLGFRNHT